MKPSAPAVEPEFLTSEHVASLLSVSVRTLWRLVQAGRFPAPVRWNRKLVRWSSRAVRAAIDALSPEPPIPAAAGPSAEQTPAPLPAPEPADEQPPLPPRPQPLAAASLDARILNVLAQSAWWQTPAQIRKAIGREVCTTAEVKEGVMRLRTKGLIQWGSAGYCRMAPKP